MHNLITRCAFSLVSLAGFSCLLPGATVNGTNTQVTVAGTDSLSAIAVGYDAVNGAIPSTFSTNFLVKSDGTGSSNPLNFANAPYTDVGGSLYFVFVLDLQETKNNESLSVDVVQLLVNSNPIWASTEAISLNTGTPLTLTPLGNGADMALYVPVAAFNGLGLTGNDTFIFSATHSLSHNGNEEWLFTDRGITTPIRFFAPGASVSDVPGVPEPSSFVLAGVGLLAAWGWVTRRV